MHGTLLQQGEGEGEGEANLRRIRHMPSPKPFTDHFLKDGRTICVGDCALFKPPQGSPPFIGIIRGLLYSKDNHLQLRVNWLYRPADLKLGKGILLEAAPNEIFYSFHKDKIPAGSLLHPCKVAFLPKGVELPSGTLAFVCRRVYDIESSRLWWLTDQDYIDERQEEVDRLLYKTRVEMHGTVPTGGHSPKPINSPTSSQLRPGSDSMQNTSYPSQGKVKKRERGDQCPDHVKRERSMKMEDGDFSPLRTESSLKSEIAKITEKGGLIDFEGVDKLVHLMQLDKVEKKMDLIYRSMLAGVIAATDKFECLNRFVQLRGLPVLDEWLQNVHKGKIGDGSSSKDGDKSVEEFLVILLAALDKLPVNLHALQMCNIGRSVNHLRSHKNLEIQKKARSLVDTWKKRVEAEMNLIDAKSGSNQSMTWPSKSRLPEASHGGNRVPVGSGDNAVKSSVTQLSASKTSLNMLSPGETTKSSISPGPVKSSSSPTSLKDGQPRIMVGGASEVPQITREDKSSSSSQSHYYSQSPSGKEDARSSTAGTSSVIKGSDSLSRQRKALNGSHLPSISSVGQKDTTNRSSSLQRNAACEKPTHRALGSEKALDVPVVEGSIQKLIVKIPNVGRSPGRVTGAGSTEDNSTMNGLAASPVLNDKNDQLEHNGNYRSDASQAGLPSDVNIQSWRSSDIKDVVVKPDYSNQLFASLPREEPTSYAEEVKESCEIVNASSESSGSKLKPECLHDGSAHTSSRSMNALIESCVKYSEANTSLSTGDDVGMNLLASVAAGEISKSDMVSALDSPQRSFPVEEFPIYDEARSKSSYGNDDHDGDDKKQVVSSASGTVDGLPPGFDGDRRASSSENKLVGVSANCSNSSYEDLRIGVDCRMEIDEKLDDGQNAPMHQEAERVLHAKPCGSFVSELKVIRDVDHAVEIAGISSSDHLSEDASKHDVTESLNIRSRETPESPSRVLDEEVLQANVSGEEVVADNVGELKSSSVDGKGSRDLVNESEKGLRTKESSSAPSVEDQTLFHLHSAGIDSKSSHVDCGDEKKQSLECPEDVQTYLEAKESKVSGAELEEKECTSMIEASFSSGGLDTDSKMKFDLNEGFNLDDGKCGEQTTMKAHVCPSNVQIVNLMPVTVSSSITVAAAAKGPFVPPEDLLRSKGELGWKGSAATSAFRPAEPRKILQVPSGSMSVAPADTPTGKPGRAPLDFDLNVPDGRVLEDLASRDSATEICSSLDLQSNQDISCSNPVRGLGGLGFDLNTVDETSDVGLCLAGNNCRLEPVAVASAKSLSSCGLSASDLRRDFDLNNGPCVDDAENDQSSFHQLVRGSVRTQPPVPSLRMNHTEIGNFSSWFPTGNSYSTVLHQSIFPERGPHPVIPSGAPARILGPGGTPFTADVLRGSVLSSTPAVPFPSNPFQYPVYPYGTTFPLPSSSFPVGSTSFMDPSSGGRLFAPPSNSQLMSPVEALSSHYPRPYVVTHPEGNNFGSAEIMSKWEKPGLDLNDGPISLDLDSRTEMAHGTFNRLSSASSQSVPEDQANVYSVRAGVSKRKELDRGWDNDSIRSKPPSWQ